MAKSSTLLENVSEVDFQSHDKHEQQKPELAEDGNGGKRRWRKDVVKSGRKEAPEDGRAEENSGGHLSDYTRLADALKYPTQHSGNEQYGAEREN